MANARDWLTNLAEILSAVECRIDGRTADLGAAEQAVVQLFEATGAKAGTVWWVGNGGSAGVCSHLAQDVLNKLGVKSLPLSDASLLTCMANDYGYDNIYRRPLETLFGPNDMLIAISSSGRSRNIVACVELAKARGIPAVSLSAFKIDNPLWQAGAKIALHIECSLYGHAEVGHEALLHGIIESAWQRQQAAKP
jgi:D-sedoheptulose 7-phosphate isomerase